MADTVVVSKVIEVDVKASAQAAAHMKQIADGMEPIKKSSQEASGSLGSMLSLVRGFVGFQILDMVGGKVAAFAGALQEASDKSRLLEERMKLVTGSSAEAGSAFQQIIDISIRQSRELDGVAKLYEKVTRNSEQLALSQRGVAIITEGVAASLRLSGASTQEANAAMLQFGQALASGKLGGDEFRSLMENNSVLMQNFAKELGTTMGGLREMSKEGDLNAGKLREAMLKVGEDGKNMMQRMIEQAEKLPKTFEGAVTGAKAALVDMVNAIQQSGEKTEGVFTKIVKKITESIREAAVRLRDYALINEEIAKQLGKQLKTDTPEAPFESRYALENLERKRLAEESLVRAQKMYDLAKSANKDAKDWDNSLNGKLFLDNIGRAKGELLAVEKILARMASQDAGDIMGGGFTTGPVKPDTSKKDKHNVGPDTARDVIDEIQTQLEDEALTLQNLLAGQDKAMSALDATLAKIDRVKSGGLSQKAIDDFKAWAHRQQEENEKTRKAVEWAKQQTAAEGFMTGATQASDERMLREIQKIKEQRLADRITQDPFIGAESEVQHLKDLALDKSLNLDDETVKIIYERIHQLREKAAKQLLGEKDPMKSVSEQMSDSWGSAFDRMENDLLDFSKSAKDIVGDFVISILSDFAKIQLKQGLQPLMTEGADFLKGLINTYMPSSDGTAWMNGVRFMAKGGLIDQPTAFNSRMGPVVGGELGTEAIIPLKRGADGNLGVGTAPVEVNVYNNGKNTSAKTERTTSPNGEQQINVYIEDMVEASLGGGRFDSVLGKSFALQRRGN